MKNYTNAISPVILFLPYESEDCIYLYKLFAKKLFSEKKFNFEIILPSNHVKTSFSKIQINGYLSYEAKIKALGSIFHNLNIWRGACDQYRRNCGLKEFFDISIANEQILDNIAISVERARIYSNKYDIFVIPDLAYTFNRALHAFALEQGKKVFVINPSGQLLNISDSSRIPVDYVTINEIEDLVKELDETQKSNLKIVTSNFLKNRILGQHSRDFDTVNTFKYSGFTNNFSFNKILFLHCIRDSSSEGYISNESVDFPNTDFFVWTESMFKLISQDQTDWKVKIHPSSFMYPNELEIIELLTKKYNLNESLFKDVPDTRTILQQKMPVYTYSGTVLYETLAVGYKSKIFSNHLPFWLDKGGNLNSVESDVGNRTNTAKNEMLLARLKLLFGSREFLPLRELVPSLPVMPEKDWFQSTVSQFKVMIKIFITRNQESRKAALEFNIRNLIFEIDGSKVFYNNLLNQLLETKIIK